MRALYTLWKVLVNLALIFLPVTLLILFALQFGQPLIKLYRDYFLGNPSRELNMTTRSLTRDQGSKVPFHRLSRQFRAVRALETISDTAGATLRRSIVRIHRAVIQRVGSGNLRAVQSSYSDSYSALLRDPLIDRLYTRPDLVRKRLLNDLRRLGRLSALPDHPARGLDRFWSSSDTVSQLIESYGSLYGNKVACRQIFDVTCNRVYGPSVKLVNRYVSQFLSNWPEFSRSLPNKADVFRERIDQLFEDFKAFVSDLERYTRAPPWSRMTSLRKTFKSYVKTYRSQLREWYRRILENVNPAPSSFSSRRWSEDFTTLRALRGIEKRIERNKELREVLLSEANKNRREVLVNRLRDLFAEISARHHFNSDFEVSGEGRRSLGETIKVLPGGTKIHRRLNRQLRRARKINRTLRNTLRSKDYERLVDLLSQMQETLQERRTDEPWKTLMREFLTGTHRRITSPEWQPTTGQETKTYRLLVKKYRKLGQKLDVSNLDQDWIDKTLLTLKSRRFNKLKRKINQLMSKLKQHEIDQVISALDELTGLEELPDQLASQVELLVFQSALLEKLQTVTTRIFEKYSDLIKTRSVFRTRWNRLRNIMERFDRDSSSSEASSANQRLNDYVKSWKEWIVNINRSTRTGKLTQDHAISRLDEYLRARISSIKKRIEAPRNESPAIDVLKDRLNRLRITLRTAQDIPGYERKHNLSQWENVLVVREGLVGLNETVTDLEGGSLWSQNTTYNNFKKKAKSFEWEPFPSSYDAETEKKQLRLIFRTIRDRTRKIHQQSRNNWLQGWGGRITGPKVIKPWRQVIETIRTEATHPEIGSVARKLVKSTDRLSLELKQENE